MNSARRGTLLLALAAAWFALKYGSNLPNTDEWDQVAPLLAPLSTDWLIAHHNEHRYPLGKLLWWCAFRLGGYDYRAASIGVVALLAAASLFFAAALRNVRGETRPSDLIVPALLLHGGHAFNLLMGYQVVFTLFVFGLAGLTWFASAPVRPNAVWATLFAVCLVTAGGFGVASTPALAVTLLLVTRGRSWPVVLTLCLTAAAACAYTAWVVSTLPPPQTRGAQSIEGFARGMIEYLAGGFGMFHPTPVLRYSFLVLTAVLYLVVVRALFALRRRWEAITFAALLVSHLSVAAAVAWVRGPHGGERFAGPSAAGLALGGVILAGFGPATPRLLQRVLLLFAVFLVAVNIGPGWRFGDQVRQSVKLFEADARSGLAPIFLAGKFGGGMPFILGDRIAGPIAQLRDRGITACRFAGPDWKLTPLPMKDSPFPVTWRDRSEKLTIAPPGRRVAGLRIVAEQHEPMGQQVLWLKWTDGVAKSWPVVPMVVPGRSAVIFRIDGEPQDILLEPGTVIRGLTLESAEWLIESP